MITPNRVLLKIIVILCGFHPICAQRKGNAQQKATYNQPLKLNHYGNNKSIIKDKQGGGAFTF